MQRPQGDAGREGHRPGWALQWGKVGCRQRHTQGTLQQVHSFTYTQTLCPLDRCMYVHRTYAYSYTCLHAQPGHRACIPTCAEAHVPNYMHRHHGNTNIITGVRSSLVCGWPSPTDMTGKPRKQLPWTVSFRPDRAQWLTERLVRS